MTKKERKKSQKLAFECKRDDTAVDKKNKRRELVKIRSEGRKIAYSWSTSELSCVYVKSSRRITFSLRGDFCKRFCLISTAMFPSPYLPSR